MSTVGTVRDKAKGPGSVSAQRGKPGGGSDSPLGKGRRSGATLTLARLGLAAGRRGGSDSLSYRLSCAAAACLTVLTAWLFLSTDQVLAQRTDRIEARLPV